MLEPYVPEELTSYIVEAYVTLRAESGQDAKNGDQASKGVRAPCFSSIGVIFYLQRASFVRVSPPFGNTVLY